jgi:hypothetical protein
MIELRKKRIKRTKVADLWTNAGGYFACFAYFAFDYRAKLAVP